MRTYPTHTYSFIADFTPHDAGKLAAGLRERKILVKPLNDPTLGLGYMRVTTALPEDNVRFVTVLWEVLSRT